MLDALRRTNLSQTLHVVEEDLYGDFFISYFANAWIPDPDDVVPLLNELILTIDSISTGIELHCIGLVHEMQTICCKSKQRQHINRQPSIRKAKGWESL
jgi:hypothetical protein